MNWLKLGPYIACGVIILVLGGLLGWKTIQVANRDTTIAKMNEQREKDIAEAVRAKLNYMDVDRKANERLEDKYFALKKELENAQAGSNQRIANVVGGCDVVYDTMLDGLRSGAPARKAGVVSTPAAP